ncbi:MAG: DUF3048 domain-containing protein [Anaerolineae bacterium]|nr:DUF3048 domain-containing protein [Anaerolineae bacterium]
MKKTLIGLLLIAIFLGSRASARAGQSLAPYSQESTATAEVVESPTAQVSHTPSPSASQTPMPSASPTFIPTQGIIATETPLSMVVPLTVNEPTPVSYGPYNFPPEVNPLTGLPVSQLNLLERRPIVVKVTNYPRSVRPQFGLSRADVVYEYYMERGVSRFIAVFYGQDAEKIGPVRSGRFFDEHIFRMYDGIFVFGSADHRVLDYFLTLGKHIVNSFMLESPEDRKNSCDINKPRHLCRDRNIVSYNNLFTNTAALTQFITERNGNYRPDLTGMRFSERSPANGSLAINVYMRYSLFIYNKWSYSVQSGRYVRYQETIGFTDPTQEDYAPHVDQLTGEQLAADNVVVLFVPHEYYVKTKTTEIINIRLLHAGNGYVYRDGFAFPIFWARPEDGGMLTLYTLDGEIFPLKPGETWYQIVSEETVLDQNGGDWRFTFVPPPVPNYPIDKSPAPPNE